MAEFDKITSYIDEASLLKETEFFLSLLKRLEDGGTTSADKLKSSFNNLFAGQTATKTVVTDMKDLQLTTANYQKVLQELAPHLDKLTAAQKERLKQVNEQYKSEEAIRQGAKESVKLIQTEIVQSAKKEAAMSELASTIARNKAEQMALNREMKLAANVLTSERNSLERAQALILKYTNEKKKLNLSTEEGRRLNESYNKAIERSNAFILKNADAVLDRIYEYLGGGSTQINFLPIPQSSADICSGVFFRGCCHGDLPLLCEGVVFPAPIWCADT